MHIIQIPLFDFDAFITKKGNDRLAKILEAFPAEGLIATLEREHWTGRKGYSVRGDVGSSHRGSVGAGSFIDRCVTAIGTGQRYKDGLRLQQGQYSQP